MTVMMAPPPLPTRFPCWCRAVYSWGGENKNDLGFVEGELIECLNAGDGSWWMGRLKRDRRVAGLFPSNFVQVLDDNFRPAERQCSPLVDSAGSSRATSPNPQVERQAKKSFRRPFKSYSAAASPGGSFSEKSRKPTEPPMSRDNSRTSRGRSPSPMRKSFSRAASPNPATKRHTWMPTPAAEDSYTSRGYDDHRYSQHNSRAPSPLPTQHREFSPEDDRQFQAEESPPPPPPPPHRSPTRPVTPVSALSPIANTPSPLRSAMEDVMNSLDTMGFKPQSGQTPEPQQQMPWSPDDIGKDWSPPKQQPARPQSAMAFANPRNGRSTPRTEPQNRYARPLSTYSAQTGPPQMSNYVERMNSLLREHKKKEEEEREELSVPDEPTSRPMGPPEIPPRRGSTKHQKSYASLNVAESPSRGNSNSSEKRMRQPKSVYDLNHNYLDRVNTTRSSVTTTSSVAPSVMTNSSHSTQLTSQSIMSGHSAGQFSATSAGSYYRRKEEPVQMAPPQLRTFHSEPMTRGSSSRSSESSSHGVTYDSGKSSISVMSDFTGSSGQPSIFGGNTVPKPKKQGFFKKMFETAKTGAATARSTLNSNNGWAPPEPTTPSLMPNNVTAISSASFAPAREMGMITPEPGSTVEWVHVRRDVNRANSLSQIERAERHDRSLMKDHLVVQPVDSLYEATDGDEGADGLPITEPCDFQQLANLNLVDKTARFINSLPPMTNPVSLAQGYICRPYRSDVQRLRAIFIWVAEKIVWEEQFEGTIDTRRVIQSKRGSAEEVAVLVKEMCAAVGIHSEVIKGFLKTPGEQIDFENGIRPNHFWNAVLIEGQWRLMDCSLASPSNPHRNAYSAQPSPNAESFWFLTRPIEFCFTHVPESHAGQHLSPPVQHEILIALPCACPTFFKNRIEMVDYDTSLTQLEGLEIMQIEFSVPPEVECAAEVEAKQFARDMDGDVFESGEVVKKRALSQAEWVGGRKVYRIKAVLPGDEGQGVLKVYAGRRGLMHSIKDIPHPLAFALPISHTGMNPPFDFLARHPTPSAARHDLYVAQPLCRRLAINNTFVFAVRQHPSAAGSVSSNGAASPVPSRPGSAMSFHSMISDTGSTNGSISGGITGSDSRPAKLGIQTPSGKILRLLRKSDHMLSKEGPGGGEAGDGSVWETIIKVSERGVWRGLVLADRTARWCVFAEWECV